MAGSKWPITWDARWIWAGPAPLPVAPIGAAGIPPKETWNRFCYLRRTVQLDAIPASVPARVTADSRFVLFVNGDWDAITDINRSRLGEPMRSVCGDLTVTNLPAGHWLPLERKSELVQTIRSWVSTKRL